MQATEVPFVSVVIPTHNRADLLPRAVESCRGIAPGCVEVIVVSNGGGYCNLEPKFEPAFNVRIISTREPNANVARNAGLEAARGRFVRFLDDDDYLLRTGAFAQHVLADRTMPDVCSGTVEVIDAAGRLLQTVEPTGQDLVASVLAPRYGTLVTAHVYRRDFLHGLTWSPERRQLQDVHWMHSLVRRSDPRWITIGQPVGVWQHHQGERTSTGALKRFPERALRDIHAIVCESLDVLSRNGRLDVPRSRAAAESLWHFAHHGFPFDPGYWSATGAQALALDPQSRPPAAMYRRTPWKYLNPLALEWCLYPYRRLKHAMETRR